jgi:hypothetical protein
METWRLLSLPFIYISPPLVCMLSQMNTFNILPSYLCNIDFNIIFQSVPKSSK